MNRAAPPSLEWLLLLLAVACGGAGSDTDGGLDGGGTEADARADAGPPDGDGSRASDDAALPDAADTRDVTPRMDGGDPGDSARDDAHGHPDTGAVDAAADAGPPRALRFVDVATEVGLGDYRGGTGETHERHGPGGVFTDLNADGFADLVLVTGPGAPTVLYENRPGTLGGRVFEASPVEPAYTPGSTGAVAADVDNDGDLDLFVAHFAEDNRLYRNRLVEDGTLSFENVTETTDPTPLVEDAQHGLARGEDDGVLLTHTMTAAFADVNRDGWVDLFVGNHYGAGTLVDQPGERDVLYMNQGDGTFLDVTHQAGVPGWEAEDGAFDNGLQHYSSTNAAIFTDLNSDLWPDLVVTNKALIASDRDMIYLNRGAPEGEWLGFHNVSYSLGSTAGTTTPLAMGIDAGDVDRDGDLDLYVTDFLAPTAPQPGPNELWRNQLVETGSFDLEVTAPQPSFFSWGVRFVDFDRDGWLDLYVSTDYTLRDSYYRGLGGGALAEEAQAVGLESFRNCRGVMTADYDGDGWVDIFVVAIDDATSHLYRNQGTHPAHHHLTVSVVGDPDLAGVHRSSRDALGARIVVTADVDGDGTTEALVREVRSGSSNAASTSSLAVDVGLGLATRADVAVHWPSGRLTTVTDVTANGSLTIAESP